MEKQLLFMTISLDGDECFSFEQILYFVFTVNIFYFYWIEIDKSKSEENYCQMNIEQWTHTPKSNKKMKKSSGTSCELWECVRCAYSIEN